MAKDVTVRINGQNPDGTFNVTMPDAGNPFMGGGTQTGAMVPYNPSANQPVQAGGYRARVGNVDVMFSSEADFLKADKAWREQMQDQGAPIVGGGGQRKPRNRELDSHRSRSCPGGRGLSPRPQHPSEAGRSRGRAPVTRRPLLMTWLDSQTTPSMPS